MNPTEIEFSVRDLVAQPYDAASFPFDLIKIYNTSPVTVGKLKSGLTNAAKEPGDLLWKKKLFFRAAGSGDDVGAIADALANDPLTVKHKPRFIVVTNGEQIHARDLQVDDTLNVGYAHLDEKSDFFLPLAGFERRVVVEEHPADIKAAKKLKKLYDAILSANPTWTSGHHTHELNLLMTRLLFCFYAEDTKIFDTAQVFTSAITQHTSEDGSDVSSFLDRIFRIMNVEETKRPKNTPAVEAKFPYVNGSLFEDVVIIPQFSRTARRQLIECGDLDWTTINPDIFGSMIQTIAQDGTRGDLGMHYTSVPNIMKVLQPLFLDNLHESYERAKDSVSKLNALLTRLANIRVFDPACGSGNFLIVAYKEARNLEIQILKRISDISHNEPLRLSCISLHSFFGIDIVDFACETAKLSLWIAEYQMNSAFREEFGVSRPTLPLGKITTIRNCNALRTDWLNICPPDEGRETYICGNPPYAGSSNQTADQKRDLDALFSARTKTYKNIDYIGGFFLKVADYLSASHGRAALVATNSICQGEQVGILWPLIYGRDVDIIFAYPSFKWQNNASNNAFVYCVIIGLGIGEHQSQKLIYVNEHRQRVNVIGPYLIPGTKLVVTKASRPLNGLPHMLRGNMPTDGGNLILSPAEYRALVENHPESVALLRRYYGAEDYINSLERWCLWIEDDLLALANSIEPVRNRIEKVRQMRLASKAPSTVAYADFPHRFRQIEDYGKEALILPRIFSDRRMYLTCGLLPANSIINDSGFAIYNPTAYLLALLSSQLHRAWTHAIAGRHGMVIGYSNTIVYNNFPVPQLSSEQMRSLTDHSKAILRARTQHPGKTLAWLYNPETMPENILRAHQENDAYLEEYVYGRKFEDDAHRLEHLFRMHERVKETNSTQARLFADSPARKAV